MFTVSLLSLIDGSFHFAHHPSSIVRVLFASGIDVFAQVKNDEDDSALRRKVYEMLVNHDLNSPLDAFDGKQIWEGDDSFVLLSSPSNSFASKSVKLCRPSVSIGQFLQTEDFSQFLGKSTPLFLDSLPGRHLLEFSLFKLGTDFNAQDMRARLREFLFSSNYPTEWTSAEWSGCLTVGSAEFCLNVINSGPGFNPMRVVRSAVNLLMNNTMDDDSMDMDADLVDTLIVDYKKTVSDVDNDDDDEAVYDRAEVYEDHRLVFPYRPEIELSDFLLNGDSHLLPYSAFTVVVNEYLPSSRSRDVALSHRSHRLQIAEVTLGRVAEEDKQHVGDKVRRGLWAMLCASCHGLCPSGTASLLSQPLPRTAGDVSRVVKAYFPYPRDVVNTIYKSDHSDSAEAQAIVYLLAAKRSKSNEDDDAGDAVRLPFGKLTPCAVQTSICFGLFGGESYLEDLPHQLCFNRLEGFSFSNDYKCQIGFYLLATKKPLNDHQRAALGSLCWSVIQDRLLNKRRDTSCWRFSDGFATTQIECALLDGGASCKGFFSVRADEDIDVLKMFDDASAIAMPVPSNRIVSRQD